MKTVDIYVAVFGRGDGVQADGEEHGPGDVGQGDGFGHVAIV